MIITSECEKCIHSVIDGTDKAKKLKYYAISKIKHIIMGNEYPAKI